MMLSVLTAHTSAVVLQGGRVINNHLSQLGQLLGCNSEFSTLWILNLTDSQDAQPGWGHNLLHYLPSFWTRITTFFLSQPSLLRRMGCFLLNFQIRWIFWSSYLLTIIHSYCNAFKYCSPLSSRLRLFTLSFTTPGDCQIVKKATYNFLGVKVWQSLLSGKVGE